MDPKVYLEGNLLSDKLIKNKIDIEFLSHMIILPTFDFDSYECLDPLKLKASIADEFSRKTIEVILGFSECDGAFKEADIAIQTDMLTMLHLVQAC